MEIIMSLLQAISSPTPLRDQLSTMLYDQFGQPTTGGTTEGTTGGEAPAPTSAESAIKEAFAVKIGGLRDLLLDVPNDRRDAEAKVGNLYDSNLGSLTSSRDLGLQSLANAEQRNESQYGTGSRRIGESGRNALRAFNNQLGTFGSGSSSAVEMGVGAIGRDQQRVQSDLFNDFQNRATDIDLAETGVQTDYGNAVNELNTWKTNTTLDILDKYESIQRELQLAVDSAVGEEKIALAQLSLDYANQAATQIEEVGQTADSAWDTYLQGIDSSVPQAQGSVAAKVGAWDPIAPSRGISGNISGAQQGLRSLPGANMIPALQRKIDESSF